ncbi:MAG TPA: PAS domain S-box protein, partial [Myxococcaceae bacterium]|nr:PAS domain S-box protein [Myxococcaceae bacterium]
MLTPPARDTTRIGAGPLSAPSGAAAWLILTGASTPAAIGTLFRLEVDEVVLGRGPEATFRIKDDGLSRRHARVSRTAEGRYMVEDLGSTNGTLLNGRPISAAQLCDGDRLQLGSVTVRFSTREQVDHGEELMRQALQAARVGIWDWSVATGAMTVSEEMVRVLGLPKGPRVLNLMDFIHPEDRDRVLRSLTSSLEQQSHLDIEFRLELADGSQRWIHCQGDVLRDAEGVAVRITGTVTDISERKRAEQELRRQAMMFESLCVYDGVVTSDLSGRIIDWNITAERMFGLSKGEVLGRTLGAVLRPDEPDVLTGAILRTLKTDGRWIGEISFKRKDAQTCFSEAVAVPLRDAEGRPIASIMVHRDITERRRMQAQLLLADRLASMGTLASGIAHEVNNPLAFICLNMDFLEKNMDRLKDRAPGDVLEQLTQVIQETKTGANRIASIVRDLKTFSRGGEQDHLGPVDLRPVVELACKMADNVIRHRARLVMDFEQVPLVDANEGRLGQVFLNLLLNAAQAIPDGRASENEIKVRVRNEGPGRVMVEVRDSGVGMSKDVLARIFDPFFTTKPVGVGTGLGLSICHGIIEAMGGKIQVESEPGKGSAFRVSLRALARKDEPRARQQAQAANPTPRARVLVVDDEPNVTSALQRSLATDHEVVTVNRAQDALAMLVGGRRFDVILCDVMMPEMTGMDLHTALLQQVPDQAAKVVFMTGGAFSPTATSFLNEVPNAKLSKPLDFSLLQS